MDNTQPISQSSRKYNRAMSIVLLFVSLFFYSLPFFTLYTDGFSALEFGDYVFIFFGSIVAVAAVYLLTVKVELTPEAQEQRKIELKENNEQLWREWYIRYPIAILMLGVAYISYKLYASNLSGVRLPAMALLLLNPISGGIAAVVAIFNAWELSLLVIIAVIIYFLYLGIAALPTSVAIIVGSIIIAYGVNKYKA